MKRLFVVAALAAACPVASAAQDRAAVAVRHADLDLSRAADVRRLDHRIAIVANELCGSRSSLDVGRNGEHARCVARARASAEPMRVAAIAAAGQQVAAAR